MRVKLRRGRVIGMAAVAAAMLITSPTVGGGGQAAVDAFVARYNTDRPHQALDQRTPVVPADRFHPGAAG